LPEPAYDNKYHYNFTTSEELNAKIEKCKVLLSGKYPAGVSQEILLEELTEMFLERRDPERRAERRENRKNNPKQNKESTGEPSRYISPATRDNVYTRDGGRCTYVGSNGKRCNTTWDLEIHHDDVPYAHGGDHNIKNLTLLCASHNKLEAERVFGRENQNKFKRKRE
jgi:5-methylcytosine-specific restriction endonuclease McrA